MTRLAGVWLVAAASLVTGAGAGIGYSRHFILPAMVKNSYINAMVLNGVMNEDVMELVAIGRTDVLYNRAESGAMFCLLPGPVHDLVSETFHSQVGCADRLRSFYRRHPERVAHLLEEFPKQAKMLGFANGK